MISIEIKMLYNFQVKRLDQKTSEQEKSKTLLSNITNQTAKVADSTASNKTEAKDKEWNDEEIKLLVKAAQVIPVGTRDRFVLK